MKNVLLLTKHLYICVQWLPQKFNIWQSPTLLFECHLLYFLEQVTFISQGLYRVYLWQAAALVMSTVCNYNKNLIDAYIHIDTQSIYTVH